MVHTRENNPVGLKVRVGGAGAVEHLRFCSSQPFVCLKNVQAAISIRKAPSPASVRPLTTKPITFEVEERPVDVKRYVVLDLD